MNQFLVSSYKMKVTVLLIVSAITVAVSDDCGLVAELDTLVAGGERVASPREFPWHVGVYSMLPGSDQVEQVCGGSIVRPDLVVTAAHCFDHLPEKYDATNVTVAAGKLHRRIYSMQDTTQQQSEVESIRVPQTYDSSWTNYQDDLAVMVLKQHFTYNSYVKPICLDFGRELDSSQLSAGNMGKVVGWGLTEANTVSQVLKVVELPFISLSTCREISDNRQYLTNDKICAGYVHGRAAVCRGDSGGGLVFARRELNSRERYFLRGVVSVALKPLDVSRKCNVDVAAMFTRVSAPQHERFLTDILTEIDAHRRKPSSCPELNSTLAPPPRASQKSRNKCIEYQQELVYPCDGVRARRDHCAHSSVPLALGERKAASTAEFPYMVLLTPDAQPTSESWVVVGTIISDKYILTTAYLLSSMPVKWVRLRARDIRGPPAPRDIRRVLRTVTHPEYRRPEIYHDLALIETDTPMELDRFAVPACLPATDAGEGVELGGGVLATGWPTPTGGLKKVSLGTRDRGMCAHTYSTWLQRGFDDNTMLCLGHDSCWMYYYYGLPALVRNSQYGCMYSVVALASSYYDCGGPVLYTQLAHYTTWIESVVWP